MVTGTSAGFARICWKAKRIDGLQLRAGEPMTIQFKDIPYKEWP